MRDQTSQHYFGLDIGTSMVRCVIGMVDPDDTSRLSVIGYGSALNQGMRKGTIVHIDDVVDAIIQAVTDTERMSGVHVKGATVNVNGVHVSGINSKGVIAISAANREIDNNDRLRVEEAATIVQLPPNREIIQVFAKNYSVDGQDNIKDPVGMHGIRLEVDTHIVTAATPSLRNIEQVFEKSKLQPSHRTVSSLAAAEAVLNRQQKESGTLLLDIGAGTTNLVVVEDGEVQHVAVIPVGGIHVTNDLAIGLKTDLDIAEKVKLQHASLSKERSKGLLRVEHEGKHYHFDPEDVYTIVEARIEELLELIDKELKRIHKSRKLPGGVVLVGGSSQIPGLAEYTKEKLQLAARMGLLQPIGGLTENVQNPSYATAVGLMMLDMLLVPSELLSQGQPNSGFFGVVDGLFKKLKS